MYSKGYALWAVALLLLVAAAVELHGRDKVRREVVRDEVMHTVAGRVPGALIRFYQKHQRIAHEGDGVEMGHLPNEVLAWRLLSNGLLEVEVRSEGQRGKPVTLRMLPVVQTGAHGLSYMFVGQLSPAMQALYGHRSWTTEADIAAQLALNEQLLRDGQATQAAGARPQGVVWTAEGPTPRTCGHSRPLLCATPGGATQRSVQHYRGRDFERLLDADAACSQAFGRSWTVWRRNTATPWRTQPTGDQEAWMHDNDPKGVNCWAAPRSVVGLN